MAGLVGGCLMLTRARKKKLPRGEPKESSRRHPIGEDYKYCPPLQEGNSLRTFCFRVLHNATLSWIARNC
jgi:hypothetical protein